MINANIALRLKDWSEKTPHSVAVNHPVKKDGKFLYDSYTFSELEQRANNIAHFFKSYGITKNSKVLTFVKPTKDFSAIVFALFKLGATPIFIDPGMGKKNLLQAIEQISPEFMVAEPIVHLISFLYSKKFKSIKVSFNIGSLEFGKIKSLKNIQENETSILEKLKPEDQAAILFTSGGTDIPKGVEYTHSIFNAQTDILKRMFQLTPQDIDMPGFPLFSLFTIAMGMKSSIPFMNPSKPASANPKDLVQNIKDQKATFVAGSPAIWVSVADYCLENSITLDTVKYLVMFGAPVNIELHKKFAKVLTNGTTYTPYGATECLPVSNTSGREILSMFNDNFQTKGTFIGKTIDENSLKIIATTDKALSWDEIEELPINTIGEIIVHGPTTTKQYVGMEMKTKEAKIQDTGMRTWHRMGDLGFIDENGNLWFCGRKSHRIKTENNNFKSSIPNELPYQQVSGVNKVAIIPNPNNVNKAAVVVERNQKVKNSTLKNDLILVTKKIQQDDFITEFYECKKLPVDIRHNIKIDRLKLSQLAINNKLKVLR